MTRHEVTVKELDEFIASQWTRFAGSFGEFSHKTLEFNPKGLYRVYQADQCVYIGGMKETAVREYNRLP
jgi:hypothetical protein